MNILFNVAKYFSYPSFYIYYFYFLFTREWFFEKKKEQENSNMGFISDKDIP